MANAILKGLKKFAPIWQAAKDQDLNEANVVTRLVRFLEEALGYDIFTHITKEFQIKGTYVDLAIRVNSKVRFYIEAKSANTTLKESHIFQAESYASQSGVNWVVLTNGSEWQIYHLAFDKTGIEHSLIHKIDLLATDDLKQSAEKLYYLSFDAVKKNELEKYWETCLSIKPDFMLKALFHADTLAAIRREIRKKSGVKISEDDALDGIRKLLNPSIVAQYGDNIKIGRRRKQNRNGNKKEGATESSRADEAQEVTPSIAESANQESGGDLDKQ